MAVEIIGDWYGKAKQLSGSDLTVRGTYVLHADPSNSSNAKYLTIRMYDDGYIGGDGIDYAAGYSINLPKEGHTLSELTALLPINIAIQINSGTVANMLLTNNSALVTITETQYEYQIRPNEIFAKNMSYWFNVPADQEFTIKTTVTVRNGTSSAITYPYIMQTGYGPIGNGIRPSSAIQALYTLRPNRFIATNRIKVQANHTGRQYGRIYASVSMLDQDMQPISNEAYSAWYNASTRIENAPSSFSDIYVVTEPTNPPPTRSPNKATVQVTQYYDNSEEFIPGALPIAKFSTSIVADWGEMAASSQLYPDTVTLTLSKKVFSDGVDYSDYIPAMTQKLPVNTKSRLLYTYSANYKYGARFKSATAVVTFGERTSTYTVTASNLAIDLDYDEIADGVSLNIEITITDSRNLSTADSASNTTYIREYHDPQITLATVARCREVPSNALPSGWFRYLTKYYVLDDEGDYCRVDWGVSIWDYQTFAEEPDRHNAKAVILLAPDGSTTRITPTAYTETGFAVFPASASSSYNLAVMVEDDFHITDDSSLPGIQYITELLRLDTEPVTMDFTHSGVENGLGFGKRAEQVNRLDIRSDWALKLWELQLVDAQTKQTTYLTNWMRSIESQLASLEGRT